jgi:hypothetical protein
MKKLIHRLSFNYRHHDYHKWIGPEDGHYSNGIRKGVAHFVYTDPWYDAVIDWIMLDVFNMNYSFNRTSINKYGWSRVYTLDSIFDDGNPFHQELTIQRIKAGLRNTKNSTMYKNIKEFIGFILVITPWFIMLYIAAIVRTPI